MPVLNELKARFRDSVNFIAITYETKEKVARFLEKHEYDFIQIIGAKSFTDKLEMKAFPVNIFLDKNCVVSNIEIGMRYPFGDNKDIKTKYRKEFEGLLVDLLSR
jgi:cytochrome c biogenesis protein CcmG, thiol:disulfide interchange protein DsbE